MTTKLEKQFFDTFGIEPCFKDWQQYNFGQVKNGLKIFPERQKLADEGYIKITHKKLEPTKDNDCIYWEEYHYPKITDKRYLELICVLGSIYICIEDMKALKDYILNQCMLNQEFIKHQV